MVAAVGVGVWAFLLPLWLALFAPDGAAAVATTARMWLSEPVAALALVGSSLGMLFSGRLGLDMAVMPGLVLAGWLWWVVLRRCGTGPCGPVGGVLRAGLGVSGWRCVPGRPRPG